ncbi:PREDICTED: probable splicing factor 3A subunit 1 [Camelina sativa]|uniref:Probable splicing factor 3A subunit 1 n=1 Tax=Camelina sativa TaxID=90675 RepID=A0ABM0T9V7_CAMSA|nr:PREDICTED: probable splicing factor 3A subunit 1 [Camelina sativa]
MKQESRAPVLASKSLLRMTMMLRISNLTLQHQNAGVVSVSKICLSLHLSSSHSFLQGSLSPARSKEFNIFKLTAQFVSVYGMYFRRALTKRVYENPLFEFFKPTDSRHRCFLKLVIGYSNVLVPSKKLVTYQKYITNFDDATEEVLDGFFKLLDQVPEKEKDGVEMAMNDLRAFEYFANVERTVLLPPPPGLIPNLVKLETLLEHVQQNQIQKRMPPATPNTKPVMSSPPPPLSLPEEPEPEKRESALVPEDQFFAQHPGSSTIRVSVPSIGAGLVIEITVESLLENVASLKEKITGEIHIPVKKQELSGKAGLLKDNKSLAHYNVGAGEILTLSLRALM